MEKNKKIIIFTVILIFLLTLFVSFFVTHKRINETSAPPNTPITSTKKGEGQSIKTILEINGNKYKDEIAGEISVYDFMSKLRNEGKINFIEKSYPVMGKFIEEINGVKNNNKQGWIYYVNGVEAQVGVSNYKIKSGDVVSWKYEKSNY